MNRVDEYIDIPGKEICFEDWYSGYPKKANKKKAEALWNKLSQVKRHKAIVDVPERKKRHAQWQDKNFIPAPDVYLRNEKFDDDIIEARSKEQEQEEVEDGSNLSRFWTLLKQTYGDERVKREYGEAMPFMWRKALEGITNRDIARIINYLMNDKERGLPNLTKVKQIRSIGRVPEFKSLPVSVSSEDVALPAFEEIKKILKGGRHETL